MERAAIQIHKEVMLAYADGANIQVYESSINKWIDVISPSFNPCYKYRVKPVKRTPYQVYMDAAFPALGPYIHQKEQKVIIKALDAVIAASKEGEFND